ncbi:MAG: hypothetical protein J5623_08505 [Clostridiales bacterium]|nr:hypothetical protein [Clostridiales bacterium]
MIAGIRADKVSEILHLSKEDSPDEKALNKQWIKFFIIFGGFTLIAVGLFLYRLLSQTRSIASSGFMIIMALVFDAYVIFKFLKVRVFLPKRFKSAIAKYGMNELTAQLTDSAALGFFIDEDNYENLAILTLDYFIGSSEFVYALRDIKAIKISKRDVNEEGVKKLKSEHNKNVLRCAYAAEITTVDGKKHTDLFAMTTPDLNAFFGYLQQRAPHVQVSYR